MQPKIWATKAFLSYAHHTVTRMGSQRGMSNYSVTRRLRRSIASLLLVCVSCSAVAGQVDAVDPLPSWKEGPGRAAIIAFVERVTDEKSPDYVAAAERIATFDNDGTLWAEQPAYFQLLFAIDRIKALAPEHPEWQTQEPFASVLKGDMKAAMAGGSAAILEMVAATHANMSVEDFERVTKEWLSTARHPTTGRRYTQMVYQPMLELLAYLRANGFATWIVSGGGIEFMRPWVEGVYGIPPQQVVGSSIKTTYEVRDGVPTLVRQPAINFIDDKEGKPVGINQHIGRKPIMAVGNSDGDFQMLEWATSGSGSGLAVLIHHTDADREWAYDRQSHIGQLQRGLDEGPGRGWVIVDMKQEWKQIFPTLR